jgi:putative DNA-invertase from lambdoid prophage Rac
LGRPAANETTAAVQRLKAQNKEQAQVATELNIGIATVKRRWNK